MPVYTPTRSAQRYLGDAKTKTVHDLLRERPECGALEIIAAGNGERFIPDKLEMALYIGYRPCPHCLPEQAREYERRQAEQAAARGTGSAVPDRPAGTGAVSGQPEGAGEVGG